MSIDSPLPSAFGKPRTSDFAGMSALIIDDNSMSRLTVSSVLKDVGIGRIKSVHGTQQARVHLQENVYDVILCEYHFSGAESGQDLLDEIRATRMVPFRTVFFMVTGEATYAKVAEVVENAPDDYLLKPFKPSALEERLEKALTRKLALQPIHASIEAKNIGRALNQCKKMVRERQAYWLDAARIAAEICVHLRKADQARKFYDLVLESKALPWAKLGIAQLAYAGNDPSAARGALEALVGESSAYADAYDLLARIYFEEGNMTQALATLRRGVEATPANLPRLQKLGSLAFLVGDSAEAEQMLSKAFRLGFSSRSFDLQSVLQLTMLAEGRGVAAKEIERYVLVLHNALARKPDDFRLMMMTRIAQVCASMARRNPADVVEGLRAMASWLREPLFDFECACNYLSLLARVSSQEIRLPEAEQWVEAVARRYCISKIAADLLCASLSEAKPLLAIVEREQARITAQANDAMSWLLKGDANATARNLTTLAGETLNARVFGLAENLALRHQQKLDDASRQLIAEAAAQRQIYCASGTQVSLARMADATRAGKTLPLD